METGGRDRRQENNKYMDFRRDKFYVPFVRPVVDGDKGVVESSDNTSTTLKWHNCNVISKNGSKDAVKKRQIIEVN